MCVWDRIFGTGFLVVAETQTGCVDPPRLSVDLAGLKGCRPMVDRGIDRLIGLKFLLQPSDDWVDGRS